MQRYVECSKCKYINPAGRKSCFKGGHDLSDAKSLSDAETAELEETGGNFSWARLVLWSLGILVSLLFTVPLIVAIGFDIVGEVPTRWDNSALVGYPGIIGLVISMSKLRSEIRKRRKR